MLQRRNQGGISVGLIGRIVSSAIKDNIREIITEVYTDFNKESRQILPPGIDSTPLPDDQGVIIELDGTSGKTAHIGVYPSASVPAGEIRIYSRDSDGNIVAQLYIKADGKHYFNSGTNYAARKEDSIQSTSVEDSTFWTWVAAVHAALQTTPANGTVSATLPTALTGKITDGTDEVLLP